MFAGLAYAGGGNRCDRQGGFLESLLILHGTTASFRDGPQGRARNPEHRLSWLKRPTAALSGSASCSWVPGSRLRRAPE